MKIRLLDAADVARVLSDRDRLAEWEQLARACPWTTAYQTPAFARAWYAVYGPAFAPLIAEGRAPNGALVGLLALALGRRNQQVVAVGAPHAPYQGWIATPAASDFILGALAACGRELSVDQLTLQYLPKGTPLDWMHRRRGGVRLAMRAVRRGLVSLDGLTIETSLQNDLNGARLRRLTQHGPVRLETLRTQRELEAVIGEIAAQCDLHQAARTGGRPFRDDPRTRQLYLTMIDEPGLLHAAVLKIGDTVVASHLGVINGASVSLGLVTCSPAHVARSPRELLLLLLARQLYDEGYRVLDLNPGDDEARDRFATHFDRVHALTVFLRRRAYARHAVAGLAARAPHRTGIDRTGVVSRVSEMRRRLGSQGLTPVLLAALQGRLARGWSLHEFRMYGLPASEVPKTESGADLRRDAIDDLLLYRPVSANEMTLKDFLAEAVRRLEEGQHVYTFAADGVLRHYSWLIERTERAGSDFGHAFALPGPAAVLWSDYTWPDARGHGLQTRSIHRRLRDAAAAGHARIFIGVRAENAVSRHNIEKVGFGHWASGWAEYRFGRVKRWITYAQMGEAPEAAAHAAQHAWK